MSAVFSIGRTWRYVLRRDLAPLDPVRSSVLFVCLNPSIADEAMDDPTVRRIIGFSRRWGYTDLAVCNLYAWRATDPSHLRRVRDPVGPDNDAWIEREAGAAHLVVVAWGVPPLGTDRPGKVLDLVRRANSVGHVYCLGTTKGGHPRHPLYLRGDAEPVPYGR